MPPRSSNRATKPTTKSKYTPASPKRTRKKPKSSPPKQAAPKKKPAKGQKKSATESSAPSSDTLIPPNTSTAASEDPANTEDESEFPINLAKTVATRKAAAKRATREEGDGENAGEEGDDENSDEEEEEEDSNEEEDEEDEEMLCLRYGDGDSNEVESEPTAKSKKKSKIPSEKGISAANTEINNKIGQLRAKWTCNVNDGSDYCWISGETRQHIPLHNPHFESWAAAWVIVLIIAVLPHTADISFLPTKLFIYVFFANCHQFCKRL
ncbi:hypothetical protein R3P38DRAFT_2813879 [Favolaschia claudopus]|uniref:Uncharacterized protein n=1 Tax=Favolaschia claudopus TaxID=2862362 RepID=A0AAV9Z432_9AGAR